MSKLNIYQTSWIDVVFENRNKDYGAYHLRQENSKTSFFALLMGISLLTAAVSIPMIYNYLNPNHTIPSIIPESNIIEVSDFNPIIPHETKPEEAAIPEIKKTPKEDVTPIKQLINPEIVAATAATTETIATNDELQKNLPINSTVGTNGTEVGTGTSKGTTGPAGPITPNVNINDPLPSSVLDKKPEFPGGINKFYTYVGNNFEKPDLYNSTAIRVSVSFVIERDGTMSNIKVLKDPGYGLGAEAIRVLKSLKTKWDPGILDGKAVRTSYNLPITIQME